MLWAFLQHWIPNWLEHNLCSIYSRTQCLRYSRRIYWFMTLKIVNIYWVIDEVSGKLAFFCLRESPECRQIVWKSCHTAAALFNFQLKEFYRFKFYTRSSYVKANSLFCVSSRVCCGLLIPVKKWKIRLEI